MTNTKIIIIDDGTSINPVWKESLEKSGFEVRIFRENSYILSIIAKEEPDLLILGLSHLWLDGTTFINKLTDWLHRLRHIDRFSRLPIVLLTGRKLPQDSMQDLRFLGVEKVLSLPVTTTELISEIRSLLDILEGNTYKNVDSGDKS